MVDPTERSLRSRLAAHLGWANTVDRPARTEAARKSRESRFLSEARKLHPTDTPKQIDDAAQSLRKAHYARLALLSAQARRARKATSAK
ncbi:hypothetical protein ACWD6I_00510 [Streptomyces sp. NPDC002454]